MGLGTKFPLSTQSRNRGFLNILIQNDTKKLLKLASSVSNHSYPLTVTLRQCFPLYLTLSLLRFHFSIILSFANHQRLRNLLFHCYQNSSDHFIGLLKITTTNENQGTNPTIQQMALFHKNQESKPRPCINKGYCGARTLILHMQNHCSLIRVPGIFFILFIEHRKIHAKTLKEITTLWKQLYFYFAILLRHFCYYTELHFTPQKIVVLHKVIFLWFVFTRNPT